MNKFLVFMIALTFALIISVKFPSFFTFIMLVALAYGSYSIPDETKR